MKIWPKRFELIRALGWVALVGLAFGIVALLTSEEVRIWTAVFFLLFVFPAFCYTYVVIIWHWKERYRGEHSDLWGALILIETSGWLKIVYLFRHLIPDMRHSGRYRYDEFPSEPSPLPPGTSDFQQPST